MNEKFEQWAIVELFGHTRIAGLVSEQALGGETFIRVDVPAVNERYLGFTKLFGKGAIYAMTFVDEETGKAAAAHMIIKPIEEWSARKMLGLEFVPLKNNLPPEEDEFDQNYLDEI